MEHLGHLGPLLKLDTIEKKGENVLREENERKRTREASAAPGMRKNQKILVKS